MTSEFLSTSEAIFRILRDSKVSYPEKIIVATRVWNSTDICFLNKVGFLSEWVCSTLIKSTGFPETRLGEAPHLNLSYWKLFKEALEKTNDSSIPSSICKLPLIPIFSSVVGYISSLDPINNYDTDDLIEHLLETVDACFHKLTTEKSTIFRPPIDQLVTLALNACNFIIIMNTFYDDYVMNIEYRQSRIVFLRFKLFSKIISFLECNLIKSSNPKRAYNVLIGKMFGKLLHVRSFVFHLKSSERQESNYYVIFSKIIKTIDNIFRHGLFQQEHIIEYVATESNQDISDKRNDGKGLINHHDQLFDKCREIINSNDDKRQSQLSVLEVIPYWYGFFIEELRKHLEHIRGAAPGESVKIIIDKRRTLEFNFFSEFWVLISEALSNLEDPNHLKTMFSIHIDLLSKVSQYDVYQIKSDEISLRQLEFLQKVADFLIFKASNIQENYMKNITFQGFDLLLKLEHRVVQSHVKSLLSLMLQQLYTESLNSCLTLGKTLLVTYSKSHEMDFYIKGFLSALNDVPDDANIILKNPLFSREYLDEFANKITNYVTMTQACELISLFTAELPSFLCQEIDARTQNKKRKLESKAVNPFLPRVNQIEPRIIFIVRFLRALKITSVSRDEIEKSFQSLFDLFIFPILSAKLDDRYECDSVSDIMIYAALNLHHCLVDISPLYWEKAVNSEFISILDNISSIDPKLQPTTNNEPENSVVIIHKYITTVLSTLDYPKNAEISWTGYLVDMTKENFAISNSMLIIIEWLDVVVNNCQKKELESIIRFIVRGLVTYSMGISNEEISMESICIQILHSAEFFELQPLRDVFLKVYLEELLSVFKNACGVNMIESDNDIKEIGMIIEIASRWHQQASSVLLDSILPCFSSPLNKQSRSNNLTDEATQKIHRLVMLLHLFPSEYFDRWEVNCLSALILLIDKVILMSQIQQSNIPINHLKNAILCRSLIRKFFLATTKQDDLLWKNQSFIMWWVSSIYTCKHHIKTIGESQQEDIDGIEIVPKQFISLVQITNETIIVISSHMFARYRENENFKIVDHLNVIISAYSVYLDHSFDQANLVFDLVISSIWKFVSDFLKLGIEFFESRRFIHGAHDREIHGVFEILLQKVEKSSLKLITFYTEEYLQQLQRDNNFKGIQVILKQITYLEEVLKAYLMSLKYYNLDFIQQQNMDAKDVQSQHLSELDSSFGILISKLPIEKYEEFSSNIINKLEEFPFTMQKGSTDKDLKFLVHLVDIFLRSSTHATVLLTKKASQYIISRKTFSFRSIDIGLILSTVISLTSSRTNLESDEKGYQNLFEESKKQKGESQSRRYVTIWDIRLKNPLPISSANSFTRLLTMISQRDSLNKFHKKKAISTRPFIKHMPCLIAEYLKVQTEGFLEPTIKETLRPGVYSLLDLCDKHERDMIMVTLDQAGKSLFKTLWTEYNKDWKYVGR
ncbi:19385_t:CDS:10, partial [Dentiscutata erythropus]